MYRTSMVFMLYYDEGKVRRGAGHTPQPFAEFRVFMIHDTKLGLRKLTNTLDIMKETIIRTMLMFESVIFAVLGDKLTHIIIATEENVKIDEDEALLNLSTTGLKDPKLNEIYRYVAFFKKNNNIYEYNELRIRTQLEVKRINREIETMFRDIVEQLIKAGRFFV